ncbi:MAG: glycosyltransferase family 4 protein [Acidobacteriaceae bacterium]|nr:glycosyltransferase family 4 protein [Acidobacteriaceae bacterium]MBV9297025.1 glycosyltransferase family 4 protein [Acidobacteriaceae bacterium]MBV9763719.1 glycosyltransferase family 4 protein [Acidobacteriaceae bacterium]
MQIRERNRARTPTTAVRVLLIAPSPEIVGGQSVQATYLFSVLSQVPNVEITRFPLDRRPPRPLLWVRRIPYLRTVFNLALYVTALMRQMPKQDILHIFSAGLSSYTLWTVPALLLGKLYRKKLIVNYRDGQAEQHITGWRSAKPTLKLADRVVAPSHYLVDVFEKYGIQAQSIFNIVDSAWFKYRERRKLRPIFLANRMLEPHYNVDCILRGFAIVQQRYPEASLTIAHDGYCRPALEKLAHDLKLQNTRFIGQVARQHVPELYDAADIYLTTPNIDCMPGSLLECLASGLPIIATKAGGIPYIVKDRETALLIDLDDDEALAQRAIELLENEDLVARLTSRGYEEVKRYHWAPVRDQWVALYRELVANGADNRTE